MFEKKKIIIAFTEEKCLKCNLSQKRKFTKGDYLFKEASKCKSCNERMIIEKIFGEEMENS